MFADSHIKVPEALHTLMKLPTAFVIKMNVFVLPLALIAARGATAARHFMFLIEDLIWALISCNSQLRSPGLSIAECRHVDSFVMFAHRAIHLSWLAPDKVCHLLQTVLPERQYGCSCSVNGCRLYWLCRSSRRCRCATEQLRPGLSA